MTFFLPGALIHIALSGPQQVKTSLKLETRRESKANRSMKFQVCQIDIVGIESYEEKPEVLTSLEEAVGKARDHSG